LILVRTMTPMAFLRWLCSLLSNFLHTSRMCTLRIPGQTDWSSKWIKREEIHDSHGPPLHFVAVTFSSRLLLTPFVDLDHSESPEDNLNEKRKLVVKVVLKLVESWWRYATFSSQ